MTIDERAPPDWSDWQGLLASPERIQQLRGLAAFFSIRDQANPIDDGKNPLGEKVRLRLAELAKSPDPWISEEAKLAPGEAQGK